MRFVKSEMVCFSDDIRRQSKIADEFGQVQHLPTPKQLREQHMAVTGMYEGEHGWG